MKSLILIPLFFTSTFVLSQSDFEKMRLSSSYKISVLHPGSYNVYGQEVPNRNKLKTHSVSAEHIFSTYRGKKFAFYFGPCYQYIHHTVVDKIQSFEAFIGFGEYETQHLADPIDLKLESHSVGLKFLGDFLIFKRKNLTMKAGIFSEFYIWERPIFLGTESSSPESNNYSTYGISPIGEKNVFVPFVNTGGEYRISKTFDSKSTLTIKLTLGTNIWASWAQFRRYIWLGTGVEFGFDNRQKEKQKKKKKTTSTSSPSSQLSWK